MMFFFHMDDVLVHDTNQDDHLKHLNVILKRFREVGLKLKLSKCAFFRRHVQYLQHLISGERIYPWKEKIASLVNLTPATDVTETRHIKDLASYHEKNYCTFHAFCQIPH